ncbi:MAG: hypothetical protein ACREDT_05195 [Methylocella sp.]
MNTTAITNFFNRINDENIPPYQVEKRLDTLALEIKRLRAQANSIEINEKSKVPVEEARLALTEGDIDGAVNYYLIALGDAKKSEQTAIATLLFVANITQNTSELLILELKYKEAADILRDGLDNLPQTLQSKQAIMLILFSEALYFGGADDVNIHKSVNDSIYLLEKTNQTSSQYYVRALAMRLRFAVSKNNLKEAKDIFYKKLRPIITSSEFDGVEYALFCYSCMAKALLDSKEITPAIDILRDGIAASKKRLIPDKVALATLYQNMAVAHQRLYDNITVGERADSEIEEAITWEKLALETALQAYPNGLHPDFAYIYITSAQLSGNEEEKIRYAVAALKIVAHFWSTKDGDYRHILSLAITIDAPEALISFDAKRNHFSIGEAGSRPAREDEFVVEGSQYSELVRQLYDIHVNKYKEEMDELNHIAYGINEFVEMLYDAGQKYLAFEYSEKVIELMKDKGENGEVCIAYYNMAHLGDTENASEKSNVEKNYRSAISICRNTKGPMHEFAVKSRERYVSFLVAERRLYDAKQFIDQIVKDDPTAFSTKEGRDHISILRKNLKRSVR